MRTREGWTWLMVGGLLLLGGCASWDRHVFQSTVERPASVAVIDVEADETLWRFDVPPSHRLTLDLAHGKGSAGADVAGRPAKQMTWKLHRVGPNALVQLDDGHMSRRVGDGRVELEGRPVRIEVSYAQPTRRETVAAPAAPGAAGVAEAEPEADSTSVEAEAASAGAE